jgi:cytochrome b6
MFQTLKYIPAQVLFIDGEILGILLFSAAGLLWTLVPFWDKKTMRGEKSKLINYLGIFAIMYILLFTILGWLV